ncbi:MAG TPA: DUF6529 family protein [Actinomycetota bacterium]|nr:DUF6529 family protein [Actinomycetota bacterium]
MDDLVEAITFGNITEVKVVLTSVVLALAVYQVFLMAVGYGKLKLPFLAPRSASFTHRAVGDSIVVVALAVAFMCIGYFEISDGIEHATDGEEVRVTVHVVAAILLLMALALKIVVVRWWHAMGRFLPAIGLSIFVLFIITWVTSAADFLWEWW